MVLFGELYGSGVQDMAYGLADGAKGFRAFDIAVDGKYLDFDTKEAVLGRRRRDGAAPLPGAVLVGGGRGADLRPDDRCVRPNRPVDSRAARGASSPP